MSKKVQKFKISFSAFLYSGPNRTGSRLKTVLYWNEFYGRYDTYDFGYGHQAFQEKEGCRVK